MIASQRSEILRFGIFELDVSAGELRKNGLRVKLQQQPLQVLICLLENAGKVVPREDLIQILWPNGTVVEYEHSLGTAVNKIRQALGDTAENPRFVETLPRRGYRCLLPVERIARSIDAHPRQAAASQTPQPGGILSHYRIVEKIGEGGMGVVYKAEDTRLERPVALKFLAAHTLESGEYKARFLREAKAAARLDHPNVCTIHEIGEVDGQTFMAMAYLEGRTLKDKIGERPLKLGEALDIAIQTAQGLKAAHEKGIVHRDIKSANLMITPQGRVKIMDFGLAQLADRSRLTQAAALLGTPAYMSPEQAQRQETDRRTDIWSLGVVIYEMLTGHLPFEGEREQAVLLAITNEEPEPVTALRSRLPAEIDRLLEKALAKKPEERYQHVADLLVDLQMLKKKVESGRSTIMRTGPTAAVATGAYAGPRQEQAESSSLAGPLARYKVIENLGEQDGLVAYRAEDTQLRRSVAIRVVPESEALKVEKRRQLQRLGILAMAVLVVLSLAFGVSQSLDKPSAMDAMPLRKFSFTPPEKLTQERGLGGVVHLAVSPNGRHVAFVAGDGRTVWIRDLANEQAREIEGTGDAGSLFWSPDSEFVGFGTDSKLKKISVEGAATITVCEVPGPYFGGGAWSPSGDSIVFASGNLPLIRLFEVPSQGGDPKPLFEPEESEKEWIAFYPQFLPRKAAAPAVVFSRDMSAKLEIVLGNLETGERFSLGSGAFPRYSSTGHIVYEASLREGGLWALPFSIKTLRPTGEAFPIARNVRFPSVADDGTLVYAGIASGGGDQQLVWMDREGTKLGDIGQPQSRILYPDLSPDERRVAVGGREGDNRADIWIHATDRPLKTRFTFDPASDYVAAWTPSGKKVTFTRMRSGNQDQFIRPADGSSEAEVLVATPLHEDTPEWSLDGRYFVYNQRGLGTLRDIVYREQQQDGSLGEAVMFLQTEFEDAAPKLSPDGKFVVYTSNESGRFEVYVRSFPDGAGRRQISTSGGTQPRWSRDGNEIFYVDQDTLMAVGVTTSPSFSSEPSQVLFPHPGLEHTGVAPIYDVANDGQRFVLAEWLDGSGRTFSIHVVQNWFAEFRDRE